MYLTKTGMQVTVVPGQRPVQAREAYTYCRPSGRSRSSSGGSSGSGSNCQTICITTDGSNTGQGGPIGPRRVCYRIGNCGGPN